MLTLPVAEKCATEVWGHNVKECSPGKELRVQTPSMTANLCQAATLGAANLIKTESGLERTTLK